jgi:hypothetical protein
MTVHFANLFSQNKNLATEFYPTWKRTFNSNSFDKYSQEGNKVYIKHSVDRDTKLDVFFVEAMIYEYKGCWVGNSKQFGKFSTFADAVDCAESVKLPEDSITQDEYISLVRS